jgi:hypothetical protein
MVSITGIVWNSENRHDLTILQTQTVNNKVISFLLGK